MFPELVDEPDGPVELGLVGQALLLLDGDEIPHDKLGKSTMPQRQKDGQRIKRDIWSEVLENYIANVGRDSIENFFWHIAWIETIRIQKVPGHFKGQGVTGSLRCRLLIMSIYKRNRCKGSNIYCNRTFRTITKNHKLKIFEVKFSQPMEGNFFNNQPL